MTSHSFLGTELPIIQAPMAGAQKSALAIAVCNANAVGSLPCALLTPEVMREELSALSQAGKPYNVNFFCHVPPVFDAEGEAKWRELLAPYFAELQIDPDSIATVPGRSPFSHEVADVLEEFKPPIVSFHFGLPAPDLLERVKQWGALVLSSATTVDEARWLEARGVDGIIAQGLEAGGHRGIFLSRNLNTQIGTFALVPQIVNAVRVPVIAAGGIADAQTVRAALTLGAAAVQVGTAYLLCPEAMTSTVHREALKRNSGHDTALTNVITGGVARGIVNRLIRELGYINSSVPAFPLATSATAALRAKAENLGSSEFSPLWAGQNISGCREVNAAEITKGLAAYL
ncbi:MAG: NAD(P)H-dependent flavin oxidoreductase [Povalibacter sp.]